jgi:arylsulfatase A-like enzyme
MSLDQNSLKHYSRSNNSRPNFLIIMVDEERYPPVYETPEIKAWRHENLPARELLRRNSMEFVRHHTGSTACSPSRATLFTGHYPSLHGVTQTTGVAKGPFDAETFWLDPNTVPTMGNYFRAAGYRTFYKGKWHITDADMLIPGTHDALPSYNPGDGVPDPVTEQYYLNSNRLERYGFDSWVGPEPHGSNPRNSGSSARFGLSGRDVVFASEVVELIQALGQDAESEQTPWLIVASFVNPHDIAIYGALSKRIPTFKFEVDGTVPPVPPPPTFREPFDTRPRCQRSYRRTFGQAFQPLVETTFYRQLYYQLQKNVDQEIMRVLDSILRSPFYRNTIIIFTSDHGELLGAHGGLTQKWYCAYDEVLRVPLIFHNPVLFSERRTVNMLTSHVDLLPTMLGLAGIDEPEILSFLSQDHTEARPLVGRDLSPLILGEGYPERTGEPVYFMTDDDITRGLDQHNFMGWDYNSVIQPNHIETVIAAFQADDGNDRQEIWKYSRYFDNQQFWTDPGREDNVLHELGKPGRIWGHIKEGLCVTTKKTEPVPEEYELYNVTADPFEMVNLADPRYATMESCIMQQRLSLLLLQQCRRKRLIPSSGAVPGMPSCSDIG